MRIVGEYDMDVVNGNGCLGAEVPGTMYIDSGGGTAGHLHGADLYAFPVEGYSAANPPNEPRPALVFSDDTEGPTRTAPRSPGTGGTCGWPTAAATSRG